MKFAIAVFSPGHAPSSRRALLFAQAALAGGHEIVRLFFYQDGVHSASANVVTPQDENDVPAQWREFVITHNLDAVVCIAAALRRGVLNDEEANRYQRPAANLPVPWELS
ncbi:MAG TPA: sulfurtransferase complex subunit TusD, partial [Pseudomonas sp.]|nr:sulfurtransferase complex subunit TusD [Pseudomonas sp.]